MWWCVALADTSTRGHREKRSGRHREKEKRMPQETAGGGVLSRVPGKEKKGKPMYLVYVEWQTGEAEILAAFTGKDAKKRAERYAEEKRHEYEAGLWISGRRYSVWGHEGNEDPSWDVTIHAEAVETNPSIPESYRRMMRRKAKTAEVLAAQTCVCDPKEGVRCCDRYARVEAQQRKAGILS
jgi:hypothetical protein